MKEHIKKTNCPKCARVAQFSSENIDEANCNYCGARLFPDRDSKVYIACPSCKLTNRMPAFGWTVAACLSCGNQIVHPCLKPRGHHLKGNGIKNDTSVTYLIPRAMADMIETLANDHETTKSSIVRYLIRLQSNMLS